MMWMARMTEIEYINEFVKMGVPYQITPTKQGTFIIDFWCEDIGLSCVHGNDLLEALVKIDYVLRG